MTSANGHGAEKPSFFDDIVGLIVVDTMLFWALASYFEGHGHPHIKDFFYFVMFSSDCGLLLKKFNSFLGIPGLLIFLWVAFSLVIAVLMIHENGVSMPNLFSGKTKFALPTVLTIAAIFSWYRALRLVPPPTAILPSEPSPAPATTEPRTPSQTLPATRPTSAPTNPSTQPATLPPSSPGTRPSSVRQERDRLCGAISNVFLISGDWLMHRWNKKNPNAHSNLNEAKWQDHYQIQQKSIEDIRELVKSGVDRWISPTLGTPPGRWTTDLLAILREVEPHLWVTNPREDITRKPADYFEAPAKALIAKGHHNATPEKLRQDFVASRQHSEKIVSQSIPKLQKMSLQLGDADISRFDQPQEGKATQASAPHENEETVIRVAHPSAARVKAIDEKVAAIEKSLAENRIDSLCFGAALAFRKIFAVFKNKSVPPQAWNGSEWVECTNENLILGAVQMTTDQDGDAQLAIPDGVAGRIRYRIHAQNGEFPAVADLKAWVGDGFWP